MLEQPEDQGDDTMLYVSFNQDSSCFAVGTERGFKIFSTYPFTDKYERVMGGGIGIVEMLYKSNILALVGGGKNPKFNRNNVVIWDDYQNKVIAELKLTSQVKNIKLKRGKLFVVCEKKAFLFNLNNYQNLDVIETSLNTKGLIAINLDPAKTIYALPSSISNNNKVSGKVKVKFYEKNKETLISAHEKDLSFLSMNNDGSILATSSENGTIIRLFRVIDGIQLKEFRRGREKAEISCIQFDNHNRFLAVGSDRGTIHIWSMGSCYKSMKEIPVNQGSKDIDETMENDGPKVDMDGELPKNNNSILKGILSFGYFNDDYSFAKVRIGLNSSICTFGPGDIIIAIAQDGKYYEAKFDLQKGGDAKVSKGIDINTK